MRRTDPPAGRGAAFAGRGAAFAGRGSNTDQVVTNSSRALSSALLAARQSGALNLRGRNLPALPGALTPPRLGLASRLAHVAARPPSVAAEVFDISSVQLPEGGKWWEMRDTLDSIDVSENALTELPSVSGTPPDVPGPLALLCPPHPCLSPSAP
eukprot:374902-Prymnesium_polylepis.1